MLFGNGLAVGSNLIINKILKSLKVSKSETFFFILQNCIDKKNKKIKAYNKKCSKCYLLIIVPDSYNGNYCSFDNKLIEHKFNSEFEKVFLYCASSNTSYVLK